MPALYFTEDDVRELLDMETAISVVETMFEELGAGRAVSVPRVRAKAPGILLHTMSASAEYLGYVGFKSYTTTSHGAKFMVGLYRIDTGELAALIDADYLGQLRTGAASGVATEYLARPESSVVGVFGTGKQARMQLKAVCSVRKIKQVEVYSRNEERRRRFAEEMSAWCNTNVIPVHAPESAACEKDIVITATTGTGPAFDGKVLDEGTHLNVIGVNFLGRREIDVSTIRRADVIACDSIEQCRLEAGDFVQALEEGVTDWPLMHELSDVVCGRATSRATPEAITLFKSVGLAIEDVALAAKLLELGREACVGHPLPF